MYFLIIRPQRTQFEEARRDAGGDPPRRHGGHRRRLVGKVTKAIDDNELEVDLGGGTKVTALRSTIIGRAGQGRAGRQPERQEITAFERRAPGRARRSCRSPIPPERKTDDALFLTLEDDLDLGDRAASASSLRCPTSCRSPGWRPCRTGAEAADDARPRPAGRLAHPACRSTARISSTSGWRPRATTSARCCATPRSAIPA